VYGSLSSGVSFLCQLIAEIRGNHPGDFPAEGLEFLAVRGKIAAHLTESIGDWKQSSLFRGPLNVALAALIATGVKVNLTYFHTFVLPVHRWLVFNCLSFIQQEQVVHPKTKEADWKRMRGHFNDQFFQQLAEMAPEAEETQLPADAISKLIDGLSTDRTQPPFVFQYPHCFSFFPIHRRAIG
jgi:hypothetical protein